MNILNNEYISHIIYNYYDNCTYISSETLFIFCTSVRAAFVAIRLSCPKGIAIAIATAL